MEGSLTLLSNMAQGLFVHSASHTLETKVVVHGTGLRTRETISWGGKLFSPQMKIKSRWFIFHTHTNDTFVHMEE